MTEPEETQGMNIGALSKATGVPVETLRTWERRYGFPDPSRDAQGHRVYDFELVPHIRMVDAAIQAGHRASAAVALDLDTLRSLFGDQGAQDIQDKNHVDPWLEATVNYDGEALEDHFRRDWARLGGVGFLKTKVHPFLRELGVAWMEKRIEVGHEHFASERLRDFLTTRWRPLSDRSQGPRIVCATLPGENHSLGLQMAATVLAIAGFRIVYLGSDTPVQDIVNAATVHQSKAVCISVSVSANRYTTSSDVTLLRESLPIATTIILGGDGAPNGIPATHIVREFDDLLAWAMPLANAHTASP